MIKIILKNFRKFEKNEFSFNEHLNLIAGKSGKGKTSIFMAIIFALTGDGKKIITYGKTSCTVKLEIKHVKHIEKLSITRSKRPNRLIVEMVQDNNLKMYEDKEAQAMIDDLFPQYYLGYMSQRVDNKSFILMSPMDKMRFIQKVAFGCENVETLSKNCRELIKERKDDIMLTSRQRETTEKMLRELNIKKIDAAEDAEDDVGRMDENEIEKELQTLLSKINNFERDIQEKKRLLDKTTSLIKIKDDLKRQLDQIPVVVENINEIENEIKNIHVQTQLYENYQREKKKLDKLEKPSNFKKDEIKVMISDMKQIIELQKQVKNIDDLQKKLTAINKQIENVSIPLTCPECDNNLELWCNNKGSAVLKKKTHEHLTNLITYEEAKKIEEQRYKIQLQLQELHQKQIQLSDLQKEYDELDDPKAQLDILYKIWRDDEEYEKQENICNSFKISSAPNSQLLQELKAKQKLKYSRSEKELSYKSIKIDHNIDTITEELAFISYDLNNFKNKQDRLQFLKTRLQSLKYWNKVEELLKHENILNQSYPRAVKLQNIIKNAEKLAIEETIEQINLHAQLYLDYFLENISVCLAFDKDGTKLNVNVIQDGFESDLNNLSGGELARVILAFTIALAEMNNVKLLLLDECVSSLDQETTTNVIQTVRNNFNGTIICIAHQTTTGIFDHVLEL